MFGRQKKPNPRTVNIEATVALNNAMREYELSGDVRAIGAVLGDHTAELLPHITENAAAVAADDPTKEGK